MNRSVAILLILPALVGCTLFRGTPVPPAPPPPKADAVVGEEGESLDALLIRGESDADAGDGDADGGALRFKPLESAREAVAAARDEDAVKELAAEQLRQATSALEQAEARWAEIADAPRGQRSALADVAHLAHAAQRWAEIAQAEVQRDIALTRAESAKKRAERRQDERQRWVGEKLVPGQFGEIRFDLGTATLTGDSTPVIDRLASFLKAHPRLRFKIAGHTDDAPPSPANLRRFLDANPDVADEHESEAARAAAYNLAMSRRRARAVAQALTGRGIDDERLEVAGYGQKRPIASNDTAEGRRRNRRVEVLVLGPT